MIKDLKIRVIKGSHGEKEGKHPKLERKEKYLK